MTQDMDQILKLMKSAILDAIKVENPENIVKGHENLIRKFIGDSPFSILSIGKASVRMSRGVDQGFLTKATNRIVLSLDGEPVEGYLSLKGNHPVPDYDTFTSSKKIVEILSNDKSKSLIFLLSGGASAMFELPVEGITNARYSEIIKKLVTAGLSIDEMNAIRCQLSKVKCGQMVNLTTYEQILILAISDVPMDDLCVIGSNPFYPGCKQVDIVGNFMKEAGVQKRDIQYRNAEVTGKIILNGEKYAQDLLNLFPDSFEKFFFGKELHDDVNVCAERIRDMIRSRYKMTGKPFFYTMCGETTSIVRGKGKGGRNCYLSTIMLDKMKKNELWAFVSLATDGADGNSGLAGFMVDSSLNSVITKSIIDEYIKQSDTGSLAVKYGRDLNIGPTGNNVSDVVLGYYGGEE